MSGFADYEAYDALGLAGLVRQGKVTPVELLDAAIARVEARNAKVNAVTMPLYDYARKAIAEGLPDGPFRGVPFLMKDLTASIAGVRMTRSSHFFADAPPPAADSEHVVRLKRAGLVIFGRTNTCELGLSLTCEPQLYGATRNPWDLTRISGGSSGGAAAAVGARMLPMAHATDGFGSIRTPAACCGLFGMKPSRGRVSFSPGGEGWAGASIQHAVTRSVRDSAALLDVACRPQPGDPYFLSTPEQPFAQDVDREPGALRIAFSTAAMQAPALDPECAAAVREAAKLCESLGHRVEEAAIPGDVMAMQAAAGVVISASVAADLDAEAERRGRPLEDADVESLTMATYRRGKAVDAATYVRGIQALHAYARAQAKLFDTYDVLLLSTLGSPAIPIGWITEQTQLIGERLFAFMPNTQAFNNTGQPAMTVPLATSSSGLPIGVQFVARMGAESTLFRLAGQLERARPWFNRTAPI